jgi:glycopeptide antibiotics resistance protein
VKILWALSVIFIVYGTTIPFRFDQTPSTVADRLSRIRLNAFEDADGSRPSIPDMTQNVLLFVPFGVLGMLTLAPHATRVSRRGRALSHTRDIGATLIALTLVTVLGSMLSAGVEVLQLFTADRVSSLNDLLTNTVGTAVGGVAIVALAAVATHAMTVLLGSVAGTDTAAFRIVLVAATVLAVATWHPFDASLDLGGLASKVRTFVTNPWQATAISDEGVDGLRYAFLAGALAVWLSNIGARYPRVMAALAGAAAAIVLELSQLIIGARMPGVKDMLVGIAGAGTGALLGLSIRASSPIVGSIAVTAVAWLASALMVLTPFTLAPERTPMGWVPFLTYYQYTAGQTVSHVLELMLAFFPIGFVLAAWPAGRWHWARVVGVALGLAMLLEYFQGWIVGRFPDVTDVAMMLLGALTGAWAAGLAVRSE